MYLFDETALKIALKENDDQSLAVGLIYLDNYDEALESVEEVRRSLLIALIDRKVNKYVSSFDGICRKLEKDKYLAILRKRAVAQMSEKRFEILDDVKTVNIGNEMAVTISVGIGLDGLTYSQNFEFSRAAIDMALGRGGDQAVVKTPEQISYYGGKSQQVEKNTRREGEGEGACAARNHHQQGQGSDHGTQAGRCGLLRRCDRYLPDCEIPGPESSDRHQ